VTSAALRLARWAAELRPAPADLAMAHRSLQDTVAVALAARSHRVTRLAASLPEGAHWAVAAHVLDFDDLHMPSTAHISAICVPMTLAVGGGPHAYLAAAGVMARLGAALGWRHYAAGWHATCTAGAPASAAGAAAALGLPPSQIAVAMALAVPAAGGVQRAFGTDAKSLQVGFAVDAGIRAAQLAAAGAAADPSAVDAWLSLAGGDPAAVDTTGPAVPGGLAVKLYPCCYALQRPISAISELAGQRPDPAQVTRIVLSTPEATVVPLIHHRPQSGLQGKFSLEYGAAVALLDGHPGLGSFTDTAVRRPAAQRLASLVQTRLTPGGSWLLDGELGVEIHSAGGAVARGSQRFPPGSPARPPSPAQLQAKLAGCVHGLDTDPAAWTWEGSAALLRRFLPGPAAAPERTATGETVAPAHRKSTRQPPEQGVSRHG
jgi:2-methylcitrate dehydratase PrpD